TKQVVGVQRNRSDKRIELLRRYRYWLILDWSRCVPRKYERVHRQQDSHAGKGSKVADQFSRVPRLPGFYFHVNTSALILRLYSFLWACSVSVVSVAVASRYRDG